MTRMFNSRRTQDFVTICTRITGDFKDKSDAEFLKKRTVKEHMIEQDITALGKLLRPNLSKASIYADIKAINAVHFMSLCVVAGKYRHEPSYIVMEMSVDGHPEDAINKLVDAIGPNLLTVFRHLKGVKNIRHMRDRLLGDRVILTRSFWPEFYSGHYRNGLPFSGTAGIDLTDVEDDEAIAVFASKQIQNLNQTVRYSDGDTDEKSANSPLDVFTYVKKAIAQNETDFDLNRAWQRALSRKSTPVFAEKSDSVWRSVWSTPRLIMTVIPRKIWMMIGLLYLTLVALMSIILFGEPIPEGVSAWDKSGFTGQGYARVRPNEKGIYEFLLTPGFIVHGMILALIIALIFSRYIRSVKKPAGALTFVTVMAAFFTFPNIFNPHLFSKQKITDLWNAAQNMLGNLQAGAQVELTIHPFLDKLLQDMTTSQIAIGTVTALAVGIPLILLVKRYVLLPLFRRFHRSLYFLTAIGSFVWLFVLGKQFFRQALLSPDDKTKVVDKITILNKWSETPQNEFTAQLPELIFVPLLLGGLMSLSFYCIVQHAPIDLKRRLSFNPSDHTDGPFEKFKNLLLTLLSPKAAYSAVFFLTAFCVTAMGFFTQGQLYELRAARMENLIFLIIIPLLTAFGMLLVYFKSFKTVDTKDKYNYQTHYWIFFVIAFALLNWKMLNNPRSLEIAASFVLAIIPTVMAVALILGFAFRTFRRSMERNGERTDNVFTDTGKAIFDSENEFAVQNHMLSVQRLIPENFRRRITLPLMLHGIISVLGGQRFRPGFLANVGTVHYARWFHLPNTNNYVFAANYDGSFESYLEDFIAKAALGTNLAWGNCEGFPQMKGLFEGGCEDGDRFKRYARRSMQPTRCWYSAYPEKSAEQIRRNAIIRDGLTKPTISPSDAQAWLDMFGSIPRPESVLEAEKIQGLLYGANGHLAYGACYTLSLSNPDKKEDAAAIKAAFSAWIDSVRGRLDYGNQKPEHEAHYLAISAAGLRKLGLSHALDEDKYTSDGAVTPLNAEPGT